MVKQKVG